MWHIWIDTGGTFTDCLALTPSQDLLRTKVLSSSFLRGRSERKVASHPVSYTHLDVYKRQDYDVDGTTSVALFYGFLKKYYTQLEYYIPDRYTEGYGVSWQGIDYAEEQGVKLIVTLDCGIKSADKVAEAQRRGIDFIICDHHRPDQHLPPAVAVLDPKREDCPYPYKELTGCGVGFKLLQALCEQGMGDEEVLYQQLDLSLIHI